MSRLIVRSFVDVRNNRPSAFFGDSLMRRLAATVASHLATPDGGRLDDDESLALLNYGEHTGGDWFAFLRRKRDRCHAILLLLLTFGALPCQCVEAPKEYAWEHTSVHNVLGNREKYDKYVAAQSKKFERGVETSKGMDWEAEWKAYEGALGRFGGVGKDSMQQVADYVREHLPLANKFALCHGANRGFEVSYLRQFLPGVEVWGTDLAPAVAKLANWTYNWDFHVVKPEWRNRTDFVYSNALDHSPKPDLAVQRWMEEVSPGGAVIIEWSKFHERRVPSATDPFGASFGQLYRVLVNAGKGHGFTVATTFNNSASHNRRSFSYRLWYVLKHV